MRKVKIITDSCADLSENQLQKYGIDYAKMTTVCDGVEKEAHLSWTADEAHAFYNVLRGGKRITTAQVSIEEFQRVFDHYLSLGMDVVYIGCSSMQSGSVNTARIIAAEMMKKHEGSSVVCIDSLNASIGIGMLAIEAAKLAERGTDTARIEEHILSVRKRVHEYVTVHSLDCLRRAGRVKGAAAFFGNIIGVKPILISDANGTQVAYKKVKGRRASLNEIVNLLKESITDPEEQTVYIAHADCDSVEIDRIADAIKAEINCKDISVGFIGPVIGASVGPDAIGIWAFGNEITYKIDS